MKYLFTLFTFFICFPVLGQFLENNPGSNHANKFEQLGSILRSPNTFRSASGAPGATYWQQKADYNIRAILDDENQILNGSETITYTNNSPDVLTYLWLQLDENQHKANTDTKKASDSKMYEKMSAKQLQKLIGAPEGHGVNILKVTDSAGEKLSYIINETMMRIELPKPLLQHQQFVFNIDWNYKIVDRMALGGRGGYEYFEDDKNYLYTITQWYPRMAVYSDFQGWQNKQFTGKSEFSLNFGDFKVSITTPADHVVGATGECKNYQKVLSPEQWNRWQKAQSTKEPLEIITLAEANQNLKSKAKVTKTWEFEAKNVRDFAFVSSRRLVWDAMKVDLDEEHQPMAMSFYGKEAYPIYKKYSTKAIAKTLDVYSKHTLAYPYPVAISVEAANGMEYPMICFNNGRAEKDGTYSEDTKYATISVIIHEIGHNFFPMIINSDERQWAWMDEGFNSFCQFMTEQEWDNQYPSKRGPAHLLTDYLKLNKNYLEPIMTNYDNVLTLRSSAYAKTAVALNILRETVMGRELFDYAFKEYARRWAFKHPTPEDFFRTMEDASAVDLDWFWRGWFFSTNPVDISVDAVRSFKLNSKNPEVKAGSDKEQYESQLNNITSIKNRESKTKFAIEEDPSLKDYYNNMDRFAVPEKEKQQFKAYYNSLSTEEKEIYEGKINFYEVDFSNIGGLVMPIIIEWTFTDGTKEIDRIPVFIWNGNEEKVTKVFTKSKKVASVLLDPYHETADIDEENNKFPRAAAPTSFELLRKNVSPTARGQSSGGNPMQKSKK